MLRGRPAKPGLFSCLRVEKWNIFPKADLSGSPCRPTKPTHFTIGCVILYKSKEGPADRRPVLILTILVAKKAPA